MTTAESNTKSLLLFNAHYLCPYAELGADDVAYITFQEHTILIVGHPEFHTNIKNKKKLDKPKEVRMAKQSLCKEMQFSKIMTDQPIVRMDIVDINTEEQDQRRHYTMETVDAGTYDVTYAIPEVQKVDRYYNLIINLTAKTERVEVAEAGLACKVFPNKDEVEIRLNGEEITGQTYVYDEVYGNTFIGDYESIKCECPLISWKKVDAPKTVVKKRRVLKIVDKLENIQ